MPQQGNQRLGSPPTATVSHAHPTPRTVRVRATGDIHDAVDGAIETSALWSLVIVLGDIAVRVCRRQSEEQTDGGIAATDDAAA